MTGIDLSLLAGLPGLIALIVCIRRGPEHAFMNVYLPSLLLLPDACRMSLSGQFNFAESAIIPIAAFYLWKEGRNWKWCLTDLLILTFAALTTISEYVNSDYWLAQHLALSMTTTTILPYIVTRGLVARDELSAEVAKKIVILTTFVAIVSIYEFRMTSNLFRHVTSTFFPEHIPEIPALRYGFVRIAGPWTHPILAGIIFAVTYRIARWLEWTRNWSGDVPFLPISKVRFCELSLLAGSVMTVSRGPWIGAIVAALIVFLLRVRHRSYVTVFAVAAVFILMVPAYSSFDAYVNVDRARSHDEAEDSAAYRKQMIQEYILIAEERPTWGWGVGHDGKALFPIIEGMESIDNHYLLVALTSGMYALTAIVLILLWAPLRLLGFVLRRSRDDSTTTLGVTFIGIFVILMISISTSWLGAQTQPLLFMIAGWSEGLLAAPLLMTAKAPSAVRRATYRFERVMV